jgi:hypothetical protein
LKKRGQGRFKEVNPPISPFRKRGKIKKKKEKRK